MKKASRIITVCGIIFFIGLSVFSYLYWDTTISWPNIYNIDDLAKYFTHESDVWFPEVEVWNLTSQSTYELYTMDRITRRTKPSGYIITSTCDFDGSKCTVRVFFQISSSSDNDRTIQIQETAHGYTSSVYNSPGRYSLSISFSYPPENKTEALLWMEDQIRSIQSHKP